MVNSVMESVKGKMNSFKWWKASLKLLSDRFFGLPWETTPNGHICPVILGLFNGRKVQAKEPLGKAQNFCWSGLGPQFQLFGWARAGTGSPS